MSTDSSSWTDITGFRLERALGPDRWEATQLELGRRVALHRVPSTTTFRAGAWPEHPSVVPFYAAIEAADGTYVATRLLRDARTLAELRTADRATPTAIAGWLRDVRAALDEAHANGIVHGNLGEDTIVVDESGRAFLTDYGCAPDGATAPDDDGAFAAIARAASMHLPAHGTGVGGATGDALRRRGVGHAVAKAASVVALVAAVAVFGVRIVHGGGSGPQPAPAPIGGATVVGSSLAADGVRTADCEGARPSGASLPCTIVQTERDGRAAVATEAGVIRAWAVRGVRGRVSLQLVRRTGSTFLAYRHSEPVQIDDPDTVRVVPDAIRIEAGDLVALAVEPGTGFGTRRTVGDTTVRFFGPLHDTPRLPNTETGANGTGEELMLRVEIVAA